MIVRSAKYSCLNEKSLYRKYRDMRTRCLNEHAARYSYYGGRGIKICDEWLNSFDAFVVWSYENGYSEGLSLERVDVNGDYCPENCKWITKTEQSYNKRNTKWVDYNGERVCLAKLCKDCDAPYEIVRRLLDRDDYDIYKAIDKAKESSKNNSKNKVVLSPVMCKYCGKMFTPIRAGVHFCRTACRKKYEAWICGTY